MAAHTEFRGRWGEGATWRHCTDDVSENCAKNYEEDGKSNQFSDSGANDEMKAFEPNMASDAYTGPFFPVIPFIYPVQKKVFFFLPRTCLQFNLFKTSRSIAASIFYLRETHGKKGRGKS